MRSHLVARAADCHVRAASSTADTLTRQLRAFAAEHGVPDTLASHLVVSWDQGTDGFTAGVDHPKHNAALEAVEYGTEDKAPLAVIRRFEASHGRHAAHLYERELQRLVRL